MGCIENAREGRKHLPKSRKVVRDLSVAWWTVTFFERQVALLFLLAGFLSTNVLRLSQTQAGVTILWPAFLQRSRVIMIFACNYTVLPACEVRTIMCPTSKYHEIYCININVIFPIAMRDTSMLWLWTPGAFKRRIEYHIQWRNDVQCEKDVHRIQRICHYWHLWSPIWILITQSDLSAWVSVYNLPKMYWSHWKVLKLTHWSVAFHRYLPGSPTSEC